MCPTTRASVTLLCSFIFASHALAILQKPKLETFSSLDIFRNASNAYMYLAKNQTTRIILRRLSPLHSRKLKKGRLRRQKGSLSR
jgi:hypothetical protein